MAQYLIRSVLTGAVSIALAASIGVAGPVKLSPEEARTAAWRALHANRPHITLELAQAMQERDPQDFEVALLKAEALRSMNRPDAALGAAKEAWSLAEEEGHRFDAAHLMAKAHFANGHTTRSQFWLRRAGQLAPTDVAKAQARKDFRYVKKTSPLSTRVTFSVFPTSNINNGSPNDRIVLNGLSYQVPVTGRPHSGTGIMAGFHTTYRKPLSRTMTARFGFRATGTTYRLSKAAKALGSGLRGSDFAYGALEVRAGFTLGPEEFDVPGRGYSRADLVLGRSWYGGNPLANYARLTLGQDFILSRQSLLQFELGAERQNRLDNKRNSATVLSASVSRRHFMGGGAELAYGIYGQDSRSASNLSASRTLGGTVSYRFAPLKFDVTPSVSLRYQETHFKRFVAGQDRRDKKLSATVSVLFPQVDYYGFAPTLNLNMSRNTSTVPIYSTKNLNMSVGFQSTF